MYSMKTQFVHHKQHGFHPYNNPTNWTCSQRVLTIIRCMISYIIRPFLGHCICYDSNISSENHAEHIHKLSAQTAKFLNVTVGVLTPGP
jgi:hypothetical protein